jgi:hypothetical protein
LTVNLTLCNKRSIAPKHKAPSSRPQQQPVTILVLLTVAAFVAFFSFFLFAPIRLLSVRSSILPARRVRPPAPA